MEYERTFNQLRMNSIFQHIIATKQVGVIIWELMHGNIFIHEEFSEYDTKSITNFTDFIRLIAYEKDLLMALQGIQNYLENPSIDYKSNFRIQTKSGEIKWVLFKGKFVANDQAEDDILQILMYDVSGRNFESGNDEITNLLNRNSFLNKLNDTITHQYPDKKHAVLGIRMHHIQEFNSYTLRSQILRQISKKLLAIIGKEDELAKFPGERFFLYLNDYTDQDELDRTAERIYALFKEPISVSKRRIIFEVSMGISIYPENSTNAIELISFAELAKRQSAKNLNRRITYFREEFAEIETRNTKIEVEFTNAIENEEFFLNYQLQVDSSTNDVVGVEALLRWSNQNLGLIPPDQFIPLAENNGYIVSIGRWVLEEAARTAKEWDGKGYDFGYISVNVSPSEFIEKDFVQHLLAVCKKHDLPHSLLGIEITESIYIQDVDNSLEKIQEMIRLGFNVSVDDFGTGYSNFIFLVQAEMNTIKIDKSIIQNVENKEMLLLVKGIINLSKDLDYDIIAEGVETAEQVELLSNLGLNKIQGYYYSRPSMKKDIEKQFKMNE